MTQKNQQVYKLLLRKRETPQPVLGLALADACTVFFTEIVHDKMYLEQKGRVEFAADTFLALLNVLYCRFNFKLSKNMIGKIVFLN